MLNKNMFLTPRNKLEGEPIEGIAPDGAPIQPEPTPKALVDCPGCTAQIPPDDLAQQLFVCSKCGHHFRMSVQARIAQLADADTFAELDAQLETQDPIAFPDYAQKLEAARRTTGRQDGVVIGTCTLGGTACALFVMDTQFMMASMGTVVGEKITRLFEYATANRLAVIGCIASGGARMQEGIFSLMQMAKTSGAVGLHSRAGLFYVALLTDPTTGGVTASFAMQSDVALAEPGALIGFAGPRVIEQTIRKTLPEGFQRAEFLLEKGFLDAIVPREAQKERLGFLLALHKEGRA